MGVVFLNITEALLRFVGVGVVFASLVACASPPGDLTLSETFSKNRTELMRLVEMLREDDKIKFLWHTSMTPQNAIDNKRWDEYRSLMSHAKIEGVLATRGRVMFIGPFPYSRYAKGFVWSTTKPHPLFGSLDSEVERIPPYAVYYRRIEGDWYIYLENLSD